MRVLAFLSFTVICCSFPAFSQNAAVAAATTACGPSGEHLKVDSETAKALPTQPEPGKALVYVIEDDGVANRIIGGNITWRVGLDGAWVVALNRHSPYTTVFGDAWRTSPLRELAIQSRIPGQSDKPGASGCRGRQDLLFPHQKMGVANGGIRGLEPGRQRSGQTPPRPATGSCEKQEVTAHPKTKQLGTFGRDRKWDAPGLAVVARPGEDGT